MYGCGGFANYIHYCQRLVTADLDQAERTLDPDQQASVLNRADARMSNDVPSLPLYQQISVAAFRSEVHNFVVNPGAQGAFWNSENWWLDR